MDIEDTVTDCRTARRRPCVEIAITPLTSLLVAFALVLPARAGTAEAPAPLLVVGHANPDTDSICSAIAMAHLKTAQGVPAQAIAQGPANTETRFVLQRFGIEEPPITERVAGRRVFLVDHTDYAQAPADLKQAELAGFADHHKLGGLASERPVEAWAAPLGATATLVTRLYAQAGIAIPQDIAGCLLAAVLSDTVRFKSATTTAEDRKAAEWLAAIAAVDDVEALGQRLLEAKSDIAGKSPAMLLDGDLKTFDMSGHKVAIAQLEFQDLAAARPIRDGLLDAMRARKRDGYHSVFLMLTDVNQGATELLYVSDDAGIVERAWGIRPAHDAAWMPGVMSRKSQIVPALEKALR